MRRRFLLPAPALLLALLLGGCSGGTGTERLYPQIFAAAQTSIALSRSRRAAAARPALTRAGLDTVEGSFIEATLERSGITAYLFASAVRFDALPGEIVQWRTEDNVTLTTRSGMLTATRGLGGDIISSELNAGSGAGPAGPGEKALYIRTGDLDEVRLSMACGLEDLGAVRLEIVERFHPVRHLRERCVAAGGGQVVNDYWIESRRNIVWQSRQWAGPHIGYLRIRRLTD